MRLKVVTLSLLLMFILSAAHAYAQEAASEVSHDYSVCDWGFPHRQGVVLVLSGGGTKGFSHIGVIEVLERENIPIAAIVGTSMGGIVGGLYASGYTTAELRQLTEESELMEIISGRAGGGPVLNPGFNRPPTSGGAPLTFFMDSDGKFLGRRGLLMAKDLYSFISELTARVSVIDFNRLPIPFAAIATDLENGDTVVMREGNLASALRATMSIPILFEPWELHGRLLVDGGLKANLPVLEAKKLFPGHPVIAVNLSPEDITRQKRQLGNIFEVSAQTLEILMVEQVRRNVAEADLVIEPLVSDFGILDTEGYEEIIMCGTVAADEKTYELRQLMKAHLAEFARHDIGSVPKETLTVTEIHFNGVPNSIAQELYERFEIWVDKPLDMKEVADAVRRLSARAEFLKVSSRINHVTDDTVAIVFNIERPQKYELNLNGYASNLHPDRWMSVSFAARDLLTDGDVASLEYRLSTKWGAMLRYFTPLDDKDRQIGMTFAVRKEEYEPWGHDRYSFERFVGKAAYYWDYGRGTRLGLGYAVERSTYSGDGTDSGPYISFTYHNLDDPVMPSRGLSATTELWYPLGEQLVSRTMFQTYIPLWGTKKAILSGGLKTGDGNKPAYTAMLGSDFELYSLAKHPLFGDQAWWVHFGTASTVMKTWWGGISIEAFGTYGEVMRDWTNSGSWWEVGLGFALQTSLAPGKIIIVYDQGGQLTFGYSIGIPDFWNGPLP